MVAGTWWSGAERMQPKANDLHGVGGEAGCVARCPSNETKSIIETLWEKVRRDAQEIIAPGVSFSLREKMPETGRARDSRQRAGNSRRAVDGAGGDSMPRKPSQGVAGARDVPRDDVRLDGIPRLGANQRPRLTRPRPPRPTPPRLAGVRNAYAAHADGATGFYVDEGSTYTNPHDGGVREALVRAVRAWPDLFAPADQPGTADDRVLDLSCGSGEVTAALVAAGVHLDRIDACDPYTGAAYERRIGKKCANIPAPRTPRVVHGDAFPLLQGRTRESIPRWRPVRWILTHENLPRRSIPHSPEPRRGPSRTSRAASSPTEAGARSSVPSPCTSALEITSRRCA